MPVIGIASDRQSNLQLQQLLLFGYGTVNPAWLDKEATEGPFQDQTSTSQHQPHQTNDGELLSQLGSSHLGFNEDRPSDLSITAHNYNSRAILGVPKPCKQHALENYDCYR
jgi:hypothetical protein